MWNKTWCRFADLLAQSLSIWLSHIHKLTQRCLTADCVAPPESDCSHIRSKVPFAWLPRYIKATQPVLEIFKMAGYFPDRYQISKTKRELSLIFRINFCVLFLFFSLSFTQFQNISFEHYFPGHWKEVSLSQHYLWMPNAPKYNIHLISESLNCLQRNTSCLCHKKFHNSA